jgi:hypothetical protein
MTSEFRVVLRVLAVGVLLGGGVICETGVKADSIALPVSIKIPGNFHRVFSDCCTPTIHVSGFWRVSNRPDTPIIDVVEEDYKGDRIVDYLKIAPTAAGQSRPDVTFRKRCGKNVAFVVSQGYRNSIPVAAMQTIILTGSEAVTVSYIRPTSEAPSDAAVHAVANVCLAAK